ncbi:hypothetical protein [Bdellovibrio svalbardensis]|uniref:Rod shape-determining protein MreD n=1 Tax=Bdellovibrio svalbardensis TaxID=2972972 RepID=A0ABT6DF81_9BACT|nr:hypothetical protein [Bdellovibrio svalbardensis]MDG0815501.1 hypothetical protein [Bdellovibrio svalbardensis]
MEKVTVPIKESALPRWTWWAPFLIITMAKVISLRYFMSDHVAWIYLPYLVSLPLYFWWGARVYPQHIVAEMMTANLYGIGDGMVIIFYGLANATKVFMGYLLYRQMCATQALRSKKGMWNFFFWVLLIQNLIGNFLFLSSYVQTGAYGSELFWRLYMINTFKDILEAAILIYPLLILATPHLRLLGLARNDFLIEEEIKTVR